MRDRKREAERVASEIDPNNPRVVTDATAPRVLGMSPRQFRDAVTRQRIPFVKLGRRTIVFFDDLHARRSAPPSPTTVPHLPFAPAPLANRRRARSAEIEAFNASIEHLDLRDRVNAVLGRIGRKMTDEAYANFYKDRPDRTER